MAEVRIAGFQEAVDEALEDVDMAGDDDAEVIEPEEEANGNEGAPEEALDLPCTTFIEYVPLTGGHGYTDNGTATSNHQS